jgi:hypothetical protein
VIFINVTVKFTSTTDDVRVVMMSGSVSFEHRQSRGSCTPGHGYSDTQSSDTPGNPEFIIHDIGDFVVLVFVTTHVQRRVRASSRDVQGLSPKRARVKVNRTRSPCAASKRNMQLKFWAPPRP